MTGATRMQHVLWVGGPPGSGKTTVARALARRNGLRLYAADDQTAAHRDRAVAGDVPAALRWASLSPQERWTGRTADELLAMTLHRERGPMVLQDLRVLPRAPMIVAEGSVLPASVFSTGLTDRSHAVWLMPTEQFQFRQLRDRGLRPEQIELYRALRPVIEIEATQHGAATIEIDGSDGPDEVVRELERRFGRAMRHGARAATVEERQELLRESNRAMVDAVRGFWAREWAPEDPGVTREFACECGDPQCGAVITLPVAEFGDEPLLSLDHF